MKEFICIFLIFTTSMVAQKDIFDVARNGSLEELKGLMKENPDIINSSNENGHTPLILASYKSNNAVALYLIEHVNDINVKADDGNALMAAVVKGNTEIVEALLKKGANPNVKDASNVTALVFATMFKSIDIVELLVNAHADKDIKDIRGYTALDYAKMIKEERLINLLKD
jgi:ankyrin repeat protein